MPYKLIWTGEGVIASFDGELNDEEARWATADVFADPRYEQIRYTIFDFSDISVQRMQDSEARDVAEIDKVFSSHMKMEKLAFVAVDEASRLLCTQYIHHAVNSSIPWEFRIFDTLPEATDWCR